MFLYVTIYYPLFFIGYKTPSLSLKSKKFDPDRSFVRIGDGEILICMWIDVHFATFTQKAFPQLQSVMRKLVGYQWDDLDLWLSLKYLTSDESATPRMEMHRLMRTYYKHVLGRNPIKAYWDAYFFRDLWSYEALVDLYAPYKIILVTKKSTIDAVKSSGGFNVVWEVVTPSNDAFSYYADVKQEICDLCVSLWNDPVLRLLISVWPMAKMLCYDLTITGGYVCHDVWSVFDMYLTGYYYSVHEKNWQ